MMLLDVCLSDVCLSVAFIGPKSRTERPRKTQIGTEVAHITHDSDTILKVKGQGQRGRGILWRPPVQLVLVDMVLLKPIFSRVFKFRVTVEIRTTFKYHYNLLRVRARYCFTNSVRPSVRLSLCLSDAGIVSKRMNISSLFLAFFIIGF